MNWVKHIFLRIEFMANISESSSILDGIEKHRKIEGTPQHNGIIERINRSLLERFRSIFNYVTTPKIVTTKTDL